MSSRTFAVLLLGIVGASLHGCGGRSGIGKGSGLAGVGGPAGMSDAAGTSGVAGISGGAGAGEAGTGAAGDAAAMPPPPLSGAKIEPTVGCKHDPKQQLGVPVRNTIETAGMKAADCADSQCGAWSYQREYYLRLPAAYDKNKAYPLVIEGPGCGGKGNNLYNNPPLDAYAIRVGLTPSADAQAFHATNPNQWCFDDHEGDDSVDFVFYEALYNRLNAEVCFDRNRVFAAGNSTGARLANELGCKYAGDAFRPIRGVMTRGAGMPMNVMYQPTCTSNPMAGIWIHETNNQTTPFTESKVALERAMRVNGCTGGATYETAAYVPFALGGNVSTCKRVTGCPAEFPLVICPLPLNSQGSNDDIVNPGWLAFLKLFEPVP